MDKALQRAALAAFVGTAAAVPALLQLLHDTRPSVINEAPLQGSPEAGVRVEITESDGEMRAAEKREGGAWVLSESGYPADHLPRLIDALAALRLTAFKTARPENFAPLAIADPGVPGAGRRLRLLDAAGNALLDLTVGKTLPAVRGEDGNELLESRFFVRRTGTPQVRLALAPLPPTQWRLRPDRTLPLPPPEALKPREAGLNAECIATLAYLPFEAVAPRTPPNAAAAVVAAVADRRIEFTDTRTQHPVTAYVGTDRVTFDVADDAAGLTARFVYLLPPERLKSCR